MTVVHINAVFGVSSTGIIVQDIHDRCISAGITSFVCSAKPPCDIKLGGPISGFIHALITRLFGLQGFGSIISTLRLIRKLDKLAPDILHLHNLHSNYINIYFLMKYLRKRRINVVITLHDSWFFTGKCYHFLDIGCDRWKTRCYDCPKRYQEIPSYLMDNSSRVFDIKSDIFNYDKLYVVGCSKWITECAKSSPILYKANFSQIYNGLDVKVFNPDGINYREKYGPKDFWILVMANKWFDNKNSNLRKAIHEILPTLGRLIIVGCNEEQSECYSTDDNVLAQGFIKDRHELAALYRTADVFINVTQVDTLPTVNMEAACCGTPVITYDSGGSAELVNDSISGYVVQTNDIEGLVSKLYQVKKGSIKREDCSSWAIKKFNRDYTYNQYLQLYKKIV